MNPSQIAVYVVFALIIVAFVVLMVFQSKRRKKQEQESKDLINAVKPGNKVKTIGGLCGIVVEVDAEENTFVLETGSVTAGKSYIKLDRQAIWQTDAVVEKKQEEESETPESENSGNEDEKSASETAPFEDVTAEQTPAEKSEETAGAPENN